MSCGGILRNSPRASEAYASENRETEASPGGMLCVWIWMTTPVTAP